MTRTLIWSFVVAGLFAGCSSSQPSQTPPPSWGVPITGGTMLVTQDGKRAVIADPDRDRLVIVELATQSAKEIPLTAGDEPGRLVEDAAGRIHVALRRGGALLTLDTSNAVTRRAACGEPRGLAYDPASDVVHVACTGGELVTFPAAGGDAVRTLHLDRDLRDVIVSNGQLYVTRFKTAELLTLDANGAITSRVVPPTVARFAGFGGGGGPIALPDAGIGDGGDGDAGIPGDPGAVPAVPAVAWRTIVFPSGKLAMLHQRQVQTILSVTHGGYGQGCNQSPVEAAITTITPGQAPFATLPAVSGALPVDIAVDKTESQIAVVLAGKGAVDIVSTSSLNSEDEGGGGCGDGMGGNGQGNEMNDQLGAPTSVQFTPTGDVLIFYPEYPALVVHSNGTAKTIALPGSIGYDAGRGLFHTQTPVGLACASCHPEGREDGLVWSFDVEGTRRTQMIAGRILDRAPYHWSGDEPDLPTLMDDVFSVRMAGPQPSHSQHLMLGPFLDRVPAPIAPPAADPAAVARGQALFESTDAGCTTCHRGSLYSTKALVDVGTGGTFKVPSLVGVGARAPYMHTGCAATLTDRFTPACGGGDTHGHTSQLTAAQISDLVAFLNTL